MNVPNSPPPSPINPFMGTPSPQPQTPAAPNQPVAVPVMPGGKDLPTNPESLANRIILPMLPGQLPSRGAEALLNPARILAILTQGMIKPKNEGSAPEASKTAGGQRDETGGKGDTGKGADLVNIQVFKPEEGNKGSQGERLGKNEMPKDADQPQVKSPSKDGSSDNNASIPVKQDPQGKEVKGDAKPGKEVPSTPNEKSPVDPQSKPGETAKQAPAAPENSQKPQDSNLPLKEGGLVKNPEQKQEGEMLKSGAGAAKADKQNAGPENPVQSPEKSQEKPQVVRPEPATISTQADRQQQQVAQQPLVDKPKDSPDRVAEKTREKEQLETVQRDDKIQNIDHPAGHRVMEHGHTQNRGDALAGAQADAGGVAHPVDTDKVIPPWIAVMFQDQQELQKLKNKGKSGGHKQSSEMVEYRFSDILFMLLAAAVCGCKSITDYVNFIQSREKWFKVILGAQCNVPPKELVWRILSSLNPANFRNFLDPWLDEVCGHPSRLKNQDGKPILPGVAIWQSPIGLIMGQSKGSDLSIDRLAIPTLLQLFDLRSGLVVAKSVSIKSDVPAFIEKVKSEFFVEIHDDSNAADEIIALIDAAAKKDSPLYDLHESYIEGQDRIVVEALKIEKSFRLPSYPTQAPANQILKVNAESIVSGTSTFRTSYYISNLANIDTEIFDLLRLQRPLDRKVAWYLNCLFPAVPMAFSLQQCQQNIMLMRQFAIGLLEKSDGELSIDEKMQLAGKSNDDLLKFIS